MHDTNFVLAELLHLLQVGLESLPLLLQLSYSFLQLHEYTDVVGCLLQSHVLYRDEVEHRLALNNSSTKAGMHGRL